MTDLSDLLALISRASDSFRTLRATIRCSRDEERFMEAWDRHWERESQEGRAGVSLVLVGDDDEPSPTTNEATIRLWIEQPGRFREEYEGAWGDQLAVFDGQTLWRRDPRLGVLREDASEAAGSLFAPLLIDPAPLLPGLELDLIGETRQAGRLAHRVRGLPNRVFWHDLGRRGARHPPSCRGAAGRRGVCRQRDRRGGFRRRLAVRALCLGARPWGAGSHTRGLG